MYVIAFHNVADYFSYDMRFPELQKIGRHERLRRYSHRVFDV